MKNLKKLCAVGMLLAVSCIIASCSSEATHELVVDVNISDVIVNEARNPNDKEFKEVYDATLKSYKKKKGDFIEMFFSKAEELNPERPFVLYFKTNSELKMSASDEDVKEHFVSQKEFCLAATKEILSARLDRLGVLGVAYAKLDYKKEQVLIGISGDADENYLRRIVQSQGNLEFFEVFKSAELGGVLSEAISVDSQDDDPNTSALSKIRVYGDLFIVSVSDKAKVDKALKKKDVIVVFPSSLKFMWGDTPIELGKGEGKKFVLYPCKIPLNGRARVDASCVKEARLGQDSEAGRITIDITMTMEGSDKWEQMTTENVDRVIAMTMEGVVFSAPHVINVITGGTTQISGSFTEEEAKEIVAIFNAGYLPVGCLFNKLRKL